MLAYLAVNFVLFFVLLFFEGAVSHGWGQPQKDCEVDVVRIHYMRFPGSQQKCYVENKIRSHAQGRKEED